MVSGSCCCGAVKFELSEPPSLVGTCHCSRCRKVGASTIAFVKRKDFKLLQGKDNISQYVPEEGYKYTRSFCKTCGSSLGEIGSEEDSFPIPANLLDGDIELTVQFHEFVREKPSWYEISDGAKQFAGHPELD
ncbi:GFA family protein [Sneathiella limimaris]|uniref:GFA family protein n=1 Tax=Sneathiella limimaris TaxID=1964213 RepID=UPI00146B8C25|nr:GFA family protein [Sneathiella limimaris]